MRVDLHVSALGPTQIICRLIKFDATRVPLLAWSAEGNAGRATDGRERVQQWPRRWLAHLVSAQQDSDLFDQSLVSRRTS